MSLSPSFVHCWLLNDVEDHFTAIWELLSIFQQRQARLSAAEIQQQVHNGLIELYDHGYVQFYEGTTFTGEEMVVMPNLTVDFIATQVEVSKSADWSVKEVKVTITASGLAYYLMHCDASFFAGVI